MPYVIVYEDGLSVELRGSFEGTSSSVLFSKLGLSDRTTIKKTPTKDLPDIKCEYFTLLERSGFILVSSNACFDNSKGRLIREYIFHKSMSEEGSHDSAWGSCPRIFLARLPTRTHVTRRLLALFKGCDWPCLESVHSCVVIMCCFFFFLLFVFFYVYFY